MCVDDTQAEYDEPVPDPTECRPCRPLTESMDPLAAHRLTRGRRVQVLALSLAVIGAAGAINLPAAVASPPAPAASSPTGQAYATLLFSRSEITAGDNCVPNDASIARLDTVVAPYLASLGIAGTGTLVTALTQDASPMCTHSGDSLGVSWADAANLAQNYGWSFVSHTATYPAHINKLTATQSYAETCGSAKTIDAHGLPGGHGLIAYPGLQPLPTSLQANYSANCFAWGRQYYYTGITSLSAASTSPYWQFTKGLNGGPCNVSTAACYTVPATGSTSHYNLPAPIVARIQALKAGQWLSLQAYILVTGTSPPYSTNGTRWDCTAADPRLHWSNDNERYCYVDWQQIVAAITARSDVKVTDPLTVGIAFGRPATYP
jgi:hypothetical protein